MKVQNLFLLLFQIYLLGCKSTTGPTKDQRIFLFDTSYYTGSVFGEAFHRDIEQVEILGGKLRFARFEIDSSRGDAIDTNAIYFDRFGYLEVGKSEMKLDTVVFTPEFISVERDSGKGALDLNRSERIRIDGKGIPRRFVVSNKEKSISVLQSDSTVFRVYFEVESGKVDFGVLKQVRQ